jgi:hypothetical protein
MINVRLYTSIGSPIVVNAAMALRSDARLKHIAQERR